MIEDWNTGFPFSFLAPRWNNLENMLQGRFGVCANRERPLAWGALAIWHSPFALDP
jgi:hypothetical protein